jgi:hypothetical protein
MKKYLLSLAVSMAIAMTATTGYSQQGELYKVPHGINDGRAARENNESPNWPGYATTTGSTRKATAMNYYGGPLITTPTIYIIWYGNWNQNNGSKGDTPAGQQLVRDWAGGIGNTPYFQLNKSLSVSGYSITGAVNFGGEATDTGTSTSLSDANIQTIVGNHVGKDLANDPSGVYFVITSSNVNASSGFCTNYCGWHTHASISTLGNIRYSFVGNAQRCLGSCAAQSTSPNGMPGIDGAISVLSHELEEATTDPDINAWLDSRGQENADKCAWTFGHYQYQTPNGSWANMKFGGHDWLIQRNILKTGSGFYCMVDATHD